MQQFDFDPSTRVLFGCGAVRQLGQVARDLGAKRVLLVSDEGLTAAGHVERACNLLDKASLETVVFNQVEENPTTAVVKAGAHFARENAPIDLIVGLGGGSSMDTAKGINFLLTNGGRMEDYLGFGMASQPMLPSIGIPTTAGTGSEAQSYALISTEDTHVKMACGDRKARFRAVLLDPELTTSMPAETAAVTAMDAVSHAVESYVTSRRNPVSQMFAREAWRLLESNFEASLQGPGDLEIRGRMLLGAHWAGAAIENSMLGAAHACANPLTTAFDIVHGTAVGLMLPHVVRFNAPVAEEWYRELAAVAGLANGEATGNAEKLSQRLSGLKRSAGLPTRLRECNVDPASFPRLAEEASRQWTGTFNPRRLEPAHWVSLFERAY